MTPEQSQIMPPDGDKEYWKALYLQERDCRIKWQQEQFKSTDAALAKTFDKWWETAREEIIHDTDPRRHAEAAWNASEKKSQIDQQK